MDMTLAGPSIAILVANGFDENHITAVQRTLTKAKQTYKMIAPEQGLVNGWQDNSWGHYFTVDAQLASALGSDYDVLILIGGERGIAKLKANPHTRRIVNHFLEAGKPVATIGSGAALLTLSPKCAGMVVAASVDAHEDLRAAGAEVIAQPIHTDGMIMSSDGSDTEAWAAGLMELIEAAQPDEADQVAA